MNQGKNAITDTELLRNILQMMDREQLQELCLYFPEKEDLGKNLRARLKEWRTDFKPLSIPEETESLRDMILETVQNTDNFTKYFWTELCQFLKDRDMKNSHLYNAIDMGGVNFNMHKKKWIADVNNHIWKSYTDRENVLAMCIVLKLNLFEIKDLMAYGGHAFSPGMNSRDFLIACCVRRGEYDPYRINELLEDAGMEPLAISPTMTGKEFKQKQERRKRSGSDTE